MNAPIYLHIITAPGETLCGAPDDATHDDCEGHLRSYDYGQRFCPYCGRAACPECVKAASGLVVES